MHAIDMGGLKFGRLYVVCRAPVPDRAYGESHKHKAWWVCRCTCERFTTVTGSSLRFGNTRSCGCLRREVSAAQGRKMRKSK